MKKKVLLGFIIVAFLFYYGPFVSANSAAPIEGDESTGIFFEKHDSVKIKEEILNIHVNGINADIESVYTMENTSDQDIENLQTLFISKNFETIEREIKITQNDIEIPYDVLIFQADYEEYPEDYIENWEKLLNDFTFPEVNQEEPFYEYILSDNINHHLSGLANPIILISGEYTTRRDDSQRQINVQSTTTFISKDPNITINSKIVNGIKIENATEYIVKNMKDSYFSADIIKYIKTINNLMTSRPDFISYEKLYYYEMNIYALDYDLNLKANETITVKIKYNYLLSHSYSRKNNDYDFVYYLSPAKYWKDFSNLTINLTLDESVPVLKKASLNFKKLGDYKYQYTSSELPEMELTFSVANSRIFGLRSCYR